MISKYLISALILVISISSPAFTQTPAASPKTDEQRQAQKELERKTLGMLDDVIKESEAFKHAENRIRVIAAAAYVLWKHDEARARTLFREAIASLVGLLKEPAVDESAEAQKMFEGPRQLRAEMLQMLAQRDPRMARELSRASRPSASEGGADPAIEDYERQLDLNLAIQIGSSDPKLAAEIARESMARGLSYQLPSVVAAIRAKDPEGAARFASDILTKLRTEKLESNADARNVAVALLQIATEVTDAEATGGAGIQTPLLDQTAIRELAEMVTVEALRSPSQNADMLASLQSMMPVVERYAPARAEQLRPKDTNTEKAPAEEAAPAESASDWPAQYTPLFETGSVDELLTAAPKAPTQVRDMLYQRAAMKLIEGGDPERARQIINEKLQDAGLREQMLKELDEAAAMKAVEMGKLEQSRKVLATLKTPEERAMALSQFAGAAAAKGEKKIALQLLDEARGMLSRRAKNVHQLSAQLIVARGYAQLDPSRSLAILEPMVDQLNELLAAATVLGGFFVEELVRDDEIMLSALSMLSGLTLLQEYADDITALASADFERTRALVDKFQRDEIRTFMRLILAQTILAPSPTQDAAGTLTTTPIMTPAVSTRAAP